MRKAPRPASTALASFLKGFSGTAWARARPANRTGKNQRDFTESRIQSWGRRSQIAGIVSVEKPFLAKRLKHAKNLVYFRCELNHPAIGQQLCPSCTKLH